MKGRRLTFGTLFGGGKTTFLLLALFFAAIIILYSIMNPMESRFAPKCMFHLLTGLDCPGCGAQRMAFALLHGRFRDAWEANPFLLLSVPLLILGVWADLRPGRIRRFVYARTTILCYIAAMILWTVGRNIF